MSVFCSKECYHKDLYRRNRNKYLNKGYQLQKTYGISVEQFELMKKEQDNKCALCLKEPKILCVDHCHKTGQVRKLLCKKCNMALGLIHEDVTIISRMLEYVRADLKKIKGD